MSFETSEALRTPTPLRVEEAAQLLKHDYLPFEAGWSIDANGMYHIATDTYMRNVTPKMLEFWFSWVHKTESYLLWHPRDHVFSDWEGPRNKKEYIGGSHLVKEYIGGELQSLKITFVDPGNYFGADWREQFEATGYGTAICARVGIWNSEDNSAVYTGHLIHLAKQEPDGIRVRSRFWLGDVDGVSRNNAMAMISPNFPKGLCKHCTEEMAILAGILPNLYTRLSDEAK